MLLHDESVQLKFSAYSPANTHTHTHRFYDALASYKMDEKCRRSSRRKAGRSLCADHSFQGQCIKQNVEMLESAMIYTRLNQV